MNEQSKQRFLEEHLILKTVSGSRAYGMALPDSDWDIRGVFIADKQHIITPFVSNAGHAREDSPEDTMFYELSKYIKLVIDQNPNVLEFLWVDPGDIIYMHPVWQPLQAARSELLSSRLLYTYSGYAMQQIHHMRSHDKWINNPKPEQAPRPCDYVSMIHNIGLAKRFNTCVPIEGEWTSVKCSNDTYLLFEGGGGSWFDLNSGNLRTLTREEAGAIIQQVPAALFKFNREKYEADKKDHTSYWTWRKNRNKARSALEEKLGYDAKNAAHLIRLMKTCNEALKEGIIRVRRPDAAELLDYRLGKYTYEQVLEEARRLDETAKENAAHTSLPKNIDRAKIAEIISKMYENFWGELDRKVQVQSKLTSTITKDNSFFKNGAPDVRGRVVCIDCEGTGYTNNGSGQIVELAAVEIIGGIQTGRVFHSYINPQGPINEYVQRIHGLTEEFLQDKPVFSEIGRKFLDFCGSSPLIMHDAKSNTKTINHDLAKSAMPVLNQENIVCSQRLARRLFPGFNMSLDMLCDTLQISRSNRIKHAALVDASLLAQCAIKMSEFPNYSTVKDVKSQKQEAKAVKVYPFSSEIINASTARITNNKTGEVIELELPDYPQETHFPIARKGTIIITNKKDGKGTKPDNPLGPAVIIPTQKGIRNYWMDANKESCEQDNQEQASARF